MVGSTRRRSITRRSSAFVALATASLLVVPMSQVAHAAPPTGGFLNPDVTAAAGPFNVISDKADGTDGTYHFVVRTNSTTSTISSVVIQIEDGDADATFETIGSATQVGSGDTWQFAWDIGAYTPAADVNSDAGTVRAVVTDAAAETANIDVAVTFSDSAGETVEITSTTNGGALGFFGTPGAATISGTGSLGVDAAGEVDLFYTNSAATVADPVWVLCGEAAGVAGTTTSTWTGTCTLAGAETGALVTAIAARADTATENDTGEALESGDAHRVTGYAQAVAGSSITITPTSDTQTVGFCNTYTVRVLDIQGNPILGANVDVEATGPNDNLQFAWNLDDAASTTDDASDNGAATHAPAAHTDATFEAIAECDGTVDATFVETQDGDVVADNKTGDDASDGTAAAGERGVQATHVAAGNDVNHIEGSTDGNGFQFSLDSDAVGSTAITAWFDSTDNEVVDGGGSEPTTTAAKTWAAAGTVTTVDGTPESEVNLAGDAHTFTCRVTDAQGNPVSGQTCRFNVTAGPDADDNNDLNSGPDGSGLTTPNGYIGDCSTDVNGTCTETFSAADQGSEVGTDTVDVFVNSAGEIGAALFVADADDPKDAGGVSKQYTPANGGGATCIDVDPNTETVGVTGNQVFTVFVTTGTFDAAGDTADAAGATNNDCPGTAVSGIALDWTITDDAPDASLVPDTDPVNEDVERVVTDVNGSATITMENDTDAVGNNTITVAEPGTATPAGDLDGVVTWAAAGTATAIDCVPEDSLKTTGTVMSFTATITDAFGTGVSGVNVDAQIQTGPNSTRDVDSNPVTAVGYVGEGTSNASGVVSFSYTGIADDTANGGNDVIDCFIDATGPDNDVDDGEGAAQADGPDVNTYMDAEEQTDVGDVSDFIDALWRTSAQQTAANVEIDLVPAGLDSAPGTTNAQTCNGNLDATFGGATWEATDTDDVNNVHLVCVSAVQAGAGDQPELNGATVTLTSTGVGTLTDSNGPPPSDATQNAVIGSDGYARFYIYSATAGTQNLVASIPGVTDTDTVVKTWNAVAAGEARIIDCEPETQTRQVNTQATVTCTVTDGLTNPVAGVAVTFSRTEAGGSTSTIVSQQTTTDANGVTFITVNSATPGTTTVTGAIQSATTECEELAGAGQGGNDTGKPAGVCSDSTNVVWQTSPVLCPGRESEPGNHIVGTSGDDVLTGTAGVDVICGLDGEDTIDGLAGADLIDGGDGRDQITGGADDDTIYGSGDNDTITGDAGADTVFAGAGDDLMNSSLGNDTMNGGNGMDEVDFFESLTSVNVDLPSESAISATTGTDDLISVENITGGPANDLIVGDSEDNRLDGAAGADEIRGGGGDDVLFGRAGADVLHGGNGQDRIYGNDGNDYGYGGDGTDRVQGGAGVDVMYGGDGTDRVGGGGGNDWVYGGLGADLILGGDGNDRLFGGSGSDDLYGGPGADDLNSRDGGEVDLDDGGTGSDNCADRDRVDVVRNCP